VRVEVWAGQVAQVTERGLSLYVPWGQSSHPVAVMYWPAGQSPDIHVGEGIVTMAEG